MCGILGHDWCVRPYQTRAGGHGVAHDELAGDTAILRG